MPVEEEQPAPGIEEPSSTAPAEEPYPAPDQPVEALPTEQPGEPYPGPVEPNLQDSVPPPEDHEFAPKLEDAGLDRGNVFLESTEILMLESYPVQVQLLLVGNLPTPCHKLRAVVSPPDDQNRIDVEVYSVVDAEMICTQVLEPFEASIPLGAYTEGSYSVWLNGEEIGSFDLP